MARTAAPGNMTISQLENLLTTRRTRLSALVRERKKLQNKLNAMDAQINSLNGRALGLSGGGGGGGRVRNEQSLVATIEKVLRNSGKPTRVGDITDAVLKTGYRTNSANFRSIVNQTLIKEKQFASAGRGLYQIKKSA